MKTAQDWIDHLGLEPHEEGGFFRQVYRSNRLLGGRVPVATSIYFLLRTQDISAFHRIASDEGWHLYQVTPATRLRVWRLTPLGELKSFVLGNDPDRAEVFQDFVPAGDWFAAHLEVLDGGDPAQAYALVGCTVSPGFQYSEFELADGDELAAAYPKHAELARKLSAGRRASSD